MADSLIAACCAAALVLLARSVLGLRRAGGTDPSAEARSVTLALYGGAVALVTLGLFITLT
ncbi:hypothetical protein J7E88_34570 [Streptomyces sp. ISL-10]|uniref:hypothetical protein n=1 Tax=Streptomyces sp. ISL-10 TaxID=2819172 RepID=UPI001BE556DF|nr:hypothetical protein [Streptomyces sp. ISL-10]MBT2370262.1 hypothetical protein [Streptomyces sp. ISL-10]